MEMLRFSLEVMQVGKSRSEYIRGTAHGRCLGESQRGLGLDMC